MTYKVDELMFMFREYRDYKQPLVQEWRLIRSLYKGQFWYVFQKHLKEYTITPDWNYFEYVVQAYLNSVYSGAFIGTLTASREEDMAAIQGLNAFIEYQWNKWGMKSKFLHVGENAELYNLGVVRVDWTESKQHIELQAISPDEIYFDPSVDNYKSGEAIFIERAVNLKDLKKNPDFAKGVEQYMKTHKESFMYDKSRPYKISGFENRETTDSLTVSLIECFVKNKKGTIDQIYILDEEIILYENTDLPIKQFPIAVYTPQRPDASPYGSSKLTKIMNTVVALNLMDSMEATQPYRLLNRVRFVNVDGRINMRSFADYGNTPGATFETKGDPRGIIYYEDIPVIPDLSNIKARLENSIFQVTGVDPYYKGRMTNSIQTTGGTQAFQARVTMLTDNSRITMLEEFCEDLTRIVLDYYFTYSTSKPYQVPQMSATGTNQVIGQFEVDFNKMREDEIKYDYRIAASTLLPMNQANLFESVKALFEMQGQYQFKKPIVTAQDVVRFSDFPQKDIWLQRLEKQDREDTAETLVADLTNFASIFSRLLSQGLSEEQAAQQAITILIEEKNAMQQDPSIGQGFR